MSAAMFSTPKPPDAASSSRIPVPASPTPLRRSLSLRAPAGGRTANHGVATPSLQRGGSFSDRGARDHGVLAQLPHQQLTTEANDVGGPTRAVTPQESARNRSLSLSLSNARLSAPKSPSVATSSPRTPPVTPDAKHTLRYASHGYLHWDSESINSATSGISVASCDHASIARNGTTFSGRRMKYVVHCNQHAGATGEDYLTPTQRAHRQVKRLKTLLQQAQKDLEQKDSDIVKLTKEVVELRLYKAALSSPEDRSNSSDAITVRENDQTPMGDGVDGGVVCNSVADMTSSYADSGHYEDYTNSSVHSKDSVNLCEEFNSSPYKSKHCAQTEDKCVAVDLSPNDYQQARDKLITEYERRIQELVRTHEEESHQLKQKHNDKVEELLQRLSEINARYWQLVPDLDAARERIKELETQLEEACQKLEQQEDKQKQTYLQMYTQGQAAAKLEQEKKILELAQQSPSRVSVPELLQQLQMTQNELENIKDLEYVSSSNTSRPLLSAKEAVSLWVLGARKAMYRQLMEAKGSKNKIDPEITLQFLKSAIYYFLTDKENNQGHLRAIQSILGFSPAEISTIEKARSS